MLSLCMTYSIDLREAALSYINNGGSRVEASRLFGCTRNTLHRWSKMDDLRPKQHGSRQRKIDMKALRRHVEGDSDMFLHDRAKVFNVSTSAMHYAMKRLGIVKKRAGI